MKCKSCETEINPKWRHAIDTNKCPFCGSEIMDEELKNLFLTLTSTIEQLSKYPDQLNDWMLLNHSYVKTDSPKLVEFVPKGWGLQTNKGEASTVKITVDGEEQEVEVKKSQSDTKTNEFFKRAEVIKPNEDFKNTSEKTQHFKNMVEQIKKTGKSSVGNGASLLVQDEGIEALDSEELAELSSMNDLTSSGEDDIPAVVLAMANSKNSSSVNQKDLMLLQQMQNKQYSSKDNFESGASRGKNGFSRSG